MLEYLIKNCVSRFFSSTTKLVDIHCNDVHVRDTCDHHLGHLGLVFLPGFKKGRDIKAS
jgi:hypothetical protein